MPSEHEPVQQSLVAWALSALGWNYAVLLTLAALFSFVLTLIVVIRGKGPMAGAALVFIVPVPLLIGLFAAIQGGISSYAVIAISGTTPKPAEVATGISTALFAPLIGMLLMVPSYTVAVFGSLVRSFANGHGRSPGKR